MKKKKINFGLGLQYLEEPPAIFFCLSSLNPTASFLLGEERKRRKEQRPLFILCIHSLTGSKKQTTTHRTTE